MSSEQQGDRVIELNVPMITRLEGEGALVLKAKEGKLESVHLKIYEPPRYFEKLLEGKHFTELPHIVARICGICPIAYQMTAVRAVETLFEVVLPDSIAALRRVTQCGEWLQSHALHIHFLAAPDYLGFDNVMGLAKRYPEEVKRGMRLQALGNDLLRLQGGRSVHPIGLKVGGYSALPDPKVIAELVERLSQAEVDCQQLARWIASLPIPDDNQTFLSVACSGDGSYPMNEGKIRVSDGAEISADEYPTHFIEHQEPHSTALFSLYRGKEPYLVGPLARINLSFDRLHPAVQTLANDLGWRFPSHNMYHSIAARVLECYYAVLEAKSILEGIGTLTMIDAAVEVTPKAGQASWVTEAPRGLIYHRYELDKEGYIKACSIIPPTSQNQARIEQDLITSVNRFGLDHSEEELKFYCERLIRNYDPCISCSVHFLKLQLLS
ncbi:Ni/Fe hydrogenase subunit alpha [Corallincola platygyrae]|uniref:Ni/Fe hydrogenase subunit alpha n=1 Tax=Corallincola platygyrae TaxID=1193278 RepID=A0ABW4XJ30_9GAMM